MTSGSDLKLKHSKPLCGTLPSRPVSVCQCFNFGGLHDEKEIRAKARGRYPMAQRARKIAGRVCTF